MKALILVWWALHMMLQCSSCPQVGRAQLSCRRGFSEMLVVWLLSGLSSCRGRWGQHSGMLCNACKVLSTIHC